MEGERNNAIKRRDEDGWRDFKDGGNKNKENGIEIKRGEKCEEKLPLFSCSG